MKRRKQLLSILPFLLLILSAIPLSAQITTSVMEIERDPDTYIGNTVIVEGIVRQYVPATSTTVAHYLLVDDHGIPIRVNTFKDQPQIDNRYRVTGYLDRDSRELVIREISRNCINCIPWLVIGIVATGVLLIVGLILYFNQSKKQAVPQPIHNPRPTPNPQPNPNPRPAPPPFDGDKDKTLIVDKDYFTMKALPGELLILSGPQKGQSMKLYGTPTQNGTVITLGRDWDKWRTLVQGRENSHIRIKDDTQTLSRMQAEIRYNPHDGNMELKNLGDTNHTQVDGKKLAVGEIADLKDGFYITAGHLKLQFKA
ncbi:MAG: FHA domain-containing protein [bacterium]